MRIYNMTATFGKLNHETITLKPGLNIIEAPNEWGKSTWCAFLVAMLYGIDSRAHSATKTGLADKTRFEPWSGQPMSGRIELNWKGRDITIERAGTKRSQFRQFHAFETATGISVPELAADNCGQMLLGVEKDVFQRAGFIRLTDMPVTQNDALRRRLNALVTTGDESGAADTLSARLTKLKNACYANSKTGLLPKAEAECKALEGSLSQLHQLQQQHQQLQSRQQQLHSHLIKLRRHREALRYHTSMQNHHRLMAARQQAHDTRTVLAELETACVGLPDREETRQTLTRLETLLSQRQALDLELQLQPKPPEPPTPPIPLPDEAPDTMDEKLRRDLKKHGHAQEQLRKNHFPLWLIGILLLAAGAALTLFWSIPGIVTGGIGTVITVVGLILRSRILRRRKELKNCLILLEREYGSDDPAQWKILAADYRAAYEAYSQTQARHHRSADALAQQLDAMDQALRALCGDTAPEAAAASCRETIAQWDALGDARREYQRAAGYVQSLEAVTIPLSAPVGSDDLTYSAEETDALISDYESRLHRLQQDLGRCMGQMESFGQESDLTARLEAAKNRVEQLQRTVSAITLAQNTLITATAQLQSRFAPRIAKRAKELFAAMTGSRYDRLSFNQDLTLDVSAQGEDILRSSLWRSDGTVDQLYLALRLAVAEALTPDAPLVLDDALVRFDDTRLKAALDILQTEAQRRQILLFTCQSRESNLL